MPRGNTSPEIAMTINHGAQKKILAAAISKKVSVSASTIGAAREALQRTAGLAAIAKWEKEHGSFSAEEMNQARRNVRAQLRRARRSA